MALTTAQKQLLCTIARQVLEQKLGKREQILQVDDPVLQEKRATFVTLKKQGALRGCIGELEATMSILASVQSNAKNAAFRDLRFSPLTEDELADIDISISILSPLQPLAYGESAELCSLLRPNKDGVLLQKGRKSATFLPQVWEQLPQVEQFLSHLCLKAGLSATSWQHDNLDVFVYEVDCFGEGNGL